MLCFFYIVFIFACIYIACAEVARSHAHACANSHRRCTLVMVSRTKIKQHPRLPGNRNLLLLYLQKLKTIKKLKVTSTYLSASSADAKEITQLALLAESVRQIWPTRPPQLSDRTLSLVLTITSLEGSKGRFVTSSSVVLSI